METALSGENDPSQTKSKRSPPSTQDVQTVTSRQAIKDPGENGGAPSVSETTTACPGTGRPYRFCHCHVLELQWHAVFR